MFKKFHELHQYKCGALCTMENFQRCTERTYLYFFRTQRTSFIYIYIYIYKLIRYALYVINDQKVYTAYIFCTQRTFFSTFLNTSFTCISMISGERISLISTHKLFSMSKMTIFGTFISLIKNYTQIYTMGKMYALYKMCIKSVQSVHFAKNV